MCAKIRGAQNQMTGNQNKVDRIPTIYTHPFYRLFITFISAATNFS